ncbi:acid phosphatase/Vanadium-dependent haloperoxidase, partial [Bimuria novae-zelandiae CBS 107.79]
PGAQVHELSSLSSRDPEALDPKPTPPLSKCQRLYSRLPKLRAPNPPDRPTFTQWLRRCWLDVLTQLLCALIALIIYLTATPLLPRYFPLYPGIQTSPWGLKYGQPYLPEYINTTVSAAVSFFVPFAVMSVMSGWWGDCFWDGNAACIGLGYALATATLVQSLIKWIIGGLRPHFLALCNPPIPPAYGGRGPSGIFYTADVCRGNPSALREAQMSFPSGHACAAFAGFGFVALYFNAKFGVFGHKPRPRASTSEALDEARGGQGVEVEVKEVQEEKRVRVSHWRLVLFVAPIVVAVLLAASKVRDAWHHPVDVVFGSLVGMLFALMAYRMVYRSVWDQRTNHLAREVYGGSEKGEVREE